MKISWVGIGLAAVLAWVGTTFLLTERFGEAHSQFRPPRIAVLDLERVFDQTEQKLELEKEIHAEFSARYKALEDLDGELERLKKEMVLVVTGSEEYQTLQKSIVHKGADLKLAEEQFKKDLELKRNTAFSSVYEVIYKKTREYAGTHGIDMILQRQLTIQQGSSPWESVFYFNPEFDITDDIIALVNGK